MKTIEEFSKRYDALGDALIKGISIKYNQSHQLTIEVVLDCMSAEKDYEWVYLEIIFYNIKEYKILKLKNQSIEVVESFAINYLSNHVIFNFLPSIIPPESIEEHRESLFYIICENFDFRELDTYEV